MSTLIIPETHIKGLQYGLIDILKCLQREAGLRQYVYAKRLSERKMTRETALREIGMMEAAVVLVNEIIDQKDHQPPLFG